MATSKEYDALKNGPLNWRQLQQENQKQFNGYVEGSEEYDDFLKRYNLRNVSLAPTYRSVYEGLEQSPLMNTQTRTSKTDYLGNSVFDINNPTTEDLSRLSDIRAENQPWYSKLVNGIGKAGVLAVTTAAETAGLLYGLGQGIYDAYNEEGDAADKAGAFLHGLWDNPITNALQRLTELSEEYMPNYYTRNEQENPFGNIFTANFLGDKLIKNFGFMVGAFYGGMPASYLIGRAGVNAVKGARAAASARMGGIASRFGELTAGYSDDILGKVGQYGREISGLSEKAAASIGKKYGDDVTGLYRKLAAEGMTESEKGKKMLESLDKINDIAQTTRATTQTIGALGSALNEGAIEAINNSKDWADMQINLANEEYAKELAEIDDFYGNHSSDNYIREKYEAAERHEKKLAEIERGRARMGNADLLLNIPILLASNMYQLGRLYTRGFDSTRRQLGSFWNGYKLSGSLAKGDLASDRTWQKGLASALYKSNTEGLEEYLQRAASDGAGKAVEESINRFMEAGTSEHAENDVADYIAGFGKAIATNLGDPNAWEEYMIGAVSSMIGMPVFGSQTKNAYGFMKNNGVFGFAGGIMGNYQDYMDMKHKEEEVARYLNDRVKDPKFRALYDNLKKQSDYEAWLQDEMAKGDKSKYKDLELEKFYEDLNAAASSGHLEEFKQLISYNNDYTDKELEDIVKETTRRISPEIQKKQDENLKTALEAAIVEAKNNNEDALVDDYTKDLEEVNKRLSGEYEEKLEGPFIDVNGQMNVTNPDGMREILERNKRNLLEGIDDYLKIRNDIDTETDGRLTDEQINFLTRLRGHINDYEKRSAEMADDVVSNLSLTQEFFDKEAEKSKKKEETAQAKYDNAKKHWEAVQKGKHNEDYKKKVEKEYLSAEKALNEAKANTKATDDALQILSILREEKDTTASERVARAAGRGEGFLGRLATRFDTKQKRAINSEELENFLGNYKDTDKPSRNIVKLAGLIMVADNIDNNVRNRLLAEVADLGRLANLKIDYRRKVGEYLGDISKINDAYKEHDAKISQKKKDDLSDELSMNIKNVRNMEELDRLMKEAHNINPEIAKLALDKVKQTADEDTKSFIADYEKASSFRDDLMRKVLSLPQHISAGNVGTIASAWEDALQGTNLYDDFIANLNEAIEIQGNSGTPGSKETASALKKILDDFDIAKSSVSTNKDIKKKKVIDGAEGGDAEVLEKVKGLSAVRKKKSDTSSTTPEEKPSDTKDTLQRDVEKEVVNSYKNGIYHINGLDGLSQALRDRIQKYNEENPGSEFLIDFTELLDRLTDERIDADKTYLGRDNLKEDGTEASDVTEDKSYLRSKKAEEMKENLRTSYRSDYATEFEIYKGPREYSEGRKYYEPTVEKLKENNPKASNRALQKTVDRLEAIQRIKTERKAYQFIDKNYLGYVAMYMDIDKEGLPVDIHFLMSTDDNVNNDVTNPVFFLAIKWDSNAQAAVRKYGFNNKNFEASNEVNPVTINGEQYQIVGTMTLDPNVNSEVSQAFSSLQGALNKELSPQLDTAKENNQEFVVSKLSTTLDQIYTGRLDKTNGDTDSKEKVSLHIFMTSKQESSDNKATENRRTSTEFSSGMQFFFGTVVNGMLNIIDDETVKDRIVEPNGLWMEKNNGAILLFVPKADGQLYPVRVTRRTVSEWLVNSDLDGTGRTGQQLLADVVSGKVKNEYLGGIVYSLKTLFDDSKSLGLKMAAKEDLQRYFILGNKSPIHFNNGNVVLKFGDIETDITSDDFEEFVNAFFNVLSDHDIMFSIPTASRDDISGVDVINSGVLEIGLRGFYNFNANFTIVPIDGNGNRITPEVTPESDAHFSAPMNMRGEERVYDFGEGNKKYYVTPDSSGSFYEVKDEEGNTVSAEESNLINMIEQARRGSIPNAMTSILDERYKSNPAVKKFVSDNIEGHYNNVYIFNLEEGWVYDGRIPNHSKRVYKLNSERGKKLHLEINNAINNFATKPDNIKRIRSLKATTSDTSLDNGTPAAPQSSKKPAPAKPATPSSSMKFAGKTIDKLDMKEGGLSEFFASNKKNPVVKKVFDAVQIAESGGKPIDETAIKRDAEAVMNEKDRNKKKAMLDELLNKISCK